jgi:hypothetical protein
MDDRYDFLMYERAGVVVLDPIGTLLPLLLVVVIAAVVANTRLPRSLKNLIYVALAFRVIGTIARYVVLFRVYGGSGDARIYYRRGLEYAEALWQLNPGPLFDRPTGGAGSGGGRSSCTFPPRWS